MRCPRCGNENSEENRFCGMCGAKLLAAPAVVASTPVAVAASSAPVAAARSSSSLSSPPARPQVVAPSRSAPISEDSSFISGPSFLGLNDPAPRKRGALNTDAQSNSSNLDYLLEDEEPKRGGAGKFVLILLMIALGLDWVLGHAIYLFELLRWLGAAYLVWLGIQAWRRAGWPVLALLGLAGLLRPEAWLFAGVYWLYLWPARSPRERLQGLHHVE